MGKSVSEFKPENVSQKVNTMVEVPQEVKRTPLLTKVFSWFIFFFVILLLGLVINKYKGKLSSFFPTIPDGSTPSGPKIDMELKKFSSFEEYKKYLESSQGSLGAYLGGVNLGSVGTTTRSLDLKAVPQASEESTAAIDRVSETNVQVKGIDEPDIVKTNGKEIFLSSEYPILYAQPVRAEISKIYPPDTNIDETKIITAFPPSSLELKAKIEKGGSLLLFDKTLVVFSNNKIYAYDVGDSSNPKEKWNFEFDQTSEIVDSRSFSGKLYVISRVTARPNSCEIPIQAGGGLRVHCTDIYHPGFSIPADSTYSVLAINPDTGEIEKKVSFLGTLGATNVYVSEKSIFATYTFYQDFLAFYYGFYSSNGGGIISADALSKIKNLNSLDISTQAKLTEFSVILQAYMNTLSSDEQLKVSTETQNRLAEYTKQRIRQLEQTGIIKISLSGLEIAATGVVPGKILNQFSLDEYQDNLRVATTVGNNFFANGVESINDVYILDKNLATLGSITDLGAGERIYSVRFIEDKGYVVTFKQVDPFYVLDLKDAKNPQKKGELKIPGYSSYLHPLATNLILGVGKEGEKVKLSLFDVSNPSEPKEVSKYSLDEYWTEIANTHHAFLQDTQNKLFSIPGSKGAYVFSYNSGNLSLLKAVSGTQVRRAIYINNFLYVIFEKGIEVVDEGSWEVVKNLDF